jgi:hypothetical protein
MVHDFAVPGELYLRLPQREGPFVGLLETHDWLEARGL